MNAADVAWMLTATALVLFMTPGLAFFYGGMVGRRSMISTMLQSFVAMGVVSILWVVVGFSLSFGDSLYGVIGNPATFFMLRGVGAEVNAALSPTIPLALFALFQMKFAIITPALITGAFAERIRFGAYILFMILFSIFVYAPLAHMTWHPNGLLRQWGVLDFAGGTVVHIAAGFAGLAGAFMVGRRFSLQQSDVHAPANVPYVILGTGMLWFGWFGFNAGSTLAANALAVNAFLTTNTAAAAAMLTWLCLDRLYGRRPSAVGACTGTVVGLVAITPAAGFVSVGASIVIGAVGAWCSHTLLQYKARFFVDDALDVFACHGVGGVVGMLLTAVFASDTAAAGGSTQLLYKHAIATLLVSAGVFAMSWILYKIVDLIIPLRVDRHAEEQGLDRSQHHEGLSAEEQALG